VQVSPAPRGYTLRLFKIKLYPLPGLHEQLFPHLPTNFAVENSAWAYFETQAL
jgi:hypothetical protein